MRDDRRLNVIARGRLRAQRSATPRLADDGADPSPPPGPADVPQVSSGESPPAQGLVAILHPVLGCRRLAEPPAPATLLWAIPEC